MAREKLRIRMPLLVLGWALGMIPVPGFFLFHLENEQGTLEVTIVPTLPNHRYLQVFRDLFECLKIREMISTAVRLSLFLTVAGETIEMKVADSSYVFNPWDKYTSETL